MESGFFSRFIYIIVAIATYALLESKQQQRIYGLRAVIEAVEADRAVDKVFVQKGLQGPLFHEMETLLQNHGIPISFVPSIKLDRMGQRNHQGVVALISPIAFQDLEDLVTASLRQATPPFFLLLDQISDVRNFGAIIRTAECTGVNGIIIPKQGSAPVNADTIKTSAGAAFRVPIAKVDHTKDAIFYLQASGIRVIAATEKTEDSLYASKLQGPTAIVMGAEDRGISPSVLKVVDERAKLPLMGEIGSLNVSVACGVFLYEVLRQRTAGE